MPQVVAAGVQVAVNQHAADRAALDALAVSLLSPLVSVAGQHLAEKFRQGITPGEQDNLASHIESVQAAGGIKAKITTSQKSERAAEWAASAADVSGEENAELAAAWRAVLEGIMLDNDYNLMEVVKGLNQSDLHAIMEMYDYKNNGGQQFHDSDIGDRLKSLRIARKLSFKARSAKLWVLMVLSAIGTGAVYYASAEIWVPRYRGSEGEPPRFDANFYRAGIVTAVLIALLLSLVFLFLRSDRLSIYVLTDYGNRFAKRMKKYLPRDHK